MFAKDLAHRILFLREYSSRSAYLRTRQAQYIAWLFLTGVHTKLGHSSTYNIALTCIMM